MTSTNNELNQPSTSEISLPAHIPNQVRAVHPEIPFEQIADEKNINSARTPTTNFSSAKII